MQNWKPKSLTPAMDQQEWEWKVGAVELCGKNRGPHDYLPIEWLTQEIPERGKLEMVTKFMCRICLHRLSIETVQDFYPLNKL